MKAENNQNQKCGKESCECNPAQDKQADDNLSDLALTSNIPQKRKEEEALDPTHFGDWQVNCRTIDF